MIRCRTQIGAAVVACSVVAAVASGALAANDPRGLDLRDDDTGRPTPLMLGPAAAAPLPAADEPALRGNPLWGIPLDSLRATRERPLFTPSRRPPTPAVIAAPPAPVKIVAAPAEPEQPPLNLLGVVIGTTDGYAVFINTTTHDIVRLRTGEGHDGWILQSVKGHEVVLEKNHRTAVVAFPQPSADKKK
jgi:general secretion pathway protein N